MCNIGVITHISIMDTFKLEKPDLNKIDGKKIMDLFFKTDGQPLRDFIDGINEPQYLYWDRMRYKQPSPQELSREELWFATKFIRQLMSIETVIKCESGKYFTWVKSKKLEKFYHEIDMSTGGGLFILKADYDKLTKQKLISRGVMEEAIASSQLEGASTSRALAKKFLREGRKPQNASEQMILNTYIANKALEEGYKDRRMDFGLICELHGMITKNTLTPEGDVPRIRKEGEDIFVTDINDGKIYHRAPKMSFVKNELERFISFANDELSHDFIHPIVKAIMLHFWIGYLHPFTDGNGRLARLLFYWYLLKNGYWAFSYLPISKMIKKAPAQYSMAYVYSEQDDCDMTYFIDFNIRKIKAAVDDFKEYTERLATLNKKMNKAAEMKYDLNERQIQLLQYLQGDSDEKTSLKMHMSIYQVSRKTAIVDLKKLVTLGFLESNKIGRNIYYYATKKVKELFN